MRYDFIQDYCLAKNGATEDYKEEWDAIRYTVCGKIFALICNDSQGRAVISVKHKPETGEDLREQYADIIPGYHLNKKHWSSVLLSGDVPDQVLKQMLDESYELIFNALSQKIRKAVSSG
ncbi:MAG: MmcQ/YjbR family DNA-binding protein [Prevotellaceae bacterium]|nr:MmcQ/YjbR family DNA-binding protein [Prevotellaceae bacterium]